MKHAAFIQISSISTLIGKYKILQRLAEPQHRSIADEVVEDIEKLLLYEVVQIKMEKSEK